VNKAFIDTNIVVYANDRADQQKQDRAIALIQSALIEGWGVISTQVLMEYSAVAIRRLGQTRETISRQTVALERMEVVTLSPAMIRDGLEYHETYGISLWDAVIVAAAAAARCDTLWSEDLSHGTRYAGVGVRNPFQYPSNNRGASAQ
jgi:predicted nucleic acid-binding protein